MELQSKKPKKKDVSDFAGKASKPKDKSDFAGKPSKPKDKSDFAGKNKAPKTAVENKSSKTAVKKKITKPRIVSKKELKASGLSLRDFLNKERGLTRRDSKKVVKKPVKVVKKKKSSDFLKSVKSAATQSKFKKSGSFKRGMTT
tara:strand:+ start:41 stop:472 length:432 start_codon:yes stop_codon:yes gene_type:complete